MVLSAGNLRPARREDYTDFARLFGELGVEEPPPPVALWEADLVHRTFFVDGPAGPRAYALTDVLGATGYVVNLVVAPGERLPSVDAEREAGQRGGGGAVHGAGERNARVDDTRAS